MSDYGRLGPIYPPEESSIDITVKVEITVEAGDLAEARDTIARGLNRSIWLSDWDWTELPE